MNKPEVIVFGFDPADPGGRLPGALLDTGWSILVQVGWPSEQWLARRQADLFVMRPAGIERAAERTRTLGRVTGRPVLWMVDPGDPEPEGLWQHLASEDWPVWALLPADAPKWQLVAVCRALMAGAGRLQQARQMVDEATRKLEDRKIIERAKGILMDRFDLAESEAYKRLRDTAMRQRKPLREIAQSIIEFTALDETGSRRSGRGRR